MEHAFALSVFGNSEAFFRALIHTAPLSMFVVSEGRCIYGNERFLRLHGCGELACGNCGLERLLDEADRQLVQGALFALKPGTARRLPLNLLLAEGKTAAVDLSVSCLLIEDRQFVLGVISEKTEKERLYRLLDRLAFHDGLTELPNRILLFDRINQALSRTQREGHPFAVAVLDLDGFKSINDTHGHAAGDAILKEVAARLRARVRGADTVARLGGDEFALILHGVGSAEEASAVLEKIIRDVARPFNCGNRKLNIHTSIGIAFHPDDGASIEQLLGRADFAMYAAKNAGGNTYRVSTGEMGRMEFRHSLEPLIDNIRLGFDIIDEQHEEIVACLRGLLTALSNNEAHDELKWRVEYLQHIVEAHFHTEEEYMAHFSLANQERHREEHANLLEQLRDLLHNPGGYGMTVMAYSMNDWLLPHIETRDAELVAQLKATGASGRHTSNSL